MMTLPFEKVLTKRFGLIYEPTIPVTLEGPDQSADVFMIIDSGADISLIPYAVGEQIGLALDMKNRRDVRGIADSSVSYILSTVNMKIGDIVVAVRMGWALSESVPLILGRLDVFRSLNIEFRESEDQIILSKASSHAST